jgi:hypothetical protein
MTSTPASDQLDGLLDVAGLHGPLLQSHQIEELWRWVGGGDELLFDDFLHALAQTCAPTWDDDTVPADRLALRLGHWRIDLGKEGVRAGLLTAVAAAALVRRGLTDLGIVFATAVLPSIFDIERIELSPGDRRLLLELRAKPALREGFTTEDNLYASLPAETRHVINRYDFADFIQRLRDAGLTDAPSEDWLRLRDPDDLAPTIIFR